MNDATFHAQTCSACRRGKPCRTADEIAQRTKKPLLNRSEQGPKPSSTRRNDR